MPLTLDTVSTDRLRGELARREACFKAGICYYCSRPLNRPGHSENCPLADQAVYEEQKWRMAQG